MGAPLRQVDPEKMPMLAMTIAAALLGGCMAFMVVALLMAKMQSGWAAAGPMTLMVLGLCPLSVVLALVLPGTLAKSFVANARLRAGEPANDPAARLRIASAATMNQVVIRTALLEGAALLAGIAVLLEGTWLAAGAFALVVAAMLALFPFPPRFESIRDGLLETMK